MVIEVLKNCVAAAVCRIRKGFSVFHSIDRVDESLHQEIFAPLSILHKKEAIDADQQLTSIATVQVARFVVLLRLCRTDYLGSCLELHRLLSPNYRSLRRDDDLHQTSVLEYPTSGCS